MNDKSADWIKTLLEPLRAESSEFFVQNVMRKVRVYDQREEWVLWPQFARWALPALALSVTGFTMAMAYTVAPGHVSTDTLLLEDREQSTAEDWFSSPPNEDQVLDAMVMKE